MMRMQRERAALEPTRGFLHTYLQCTFQEASSRPSLSAHKSKSYEEREHDYNEARSRIFNTESVSLSQCLHM